MPKSDHYTLQCSHCGVMFQGVARQAQTVAGGGKVFCGWSCSQAARKIRCEPLECNYCGQKFTPTENVGYRMRRARAGHPVFCSTKCVAAKRRGVRSPTTKIRCRICRRAFPKKSDGRGGIVRTCSPECGAEARRRTRARTLQERDVEKQINVRFPGRWARDANFCPLESWFAEAAP